MSIDGTPRFDEGQVVVVDGFFFLEEVALVAELLCGLADQIDEPAGGAGFALDVEILVADHVGEHEGLDAAESSVAAPFGCEVAAADRWSRSADQCSNGFFAVEEDQPHGVAFELFAAAVCAQLVGDGHQQAGGCRAVVGADEVDVAQRVVGLVVGGEDDDAVFFAGEAHDEVAQGDRADGGVGGEGVFFKLVVLEMGARNCSALAWPGLVGQRGTDGDEVAGVLVGFAAVEVLGGEGEQG